MGLNPRKGGIELQPQLLLWSWERNSQRAQPHRGPGKGAEGLASQIYELPSKVFIEWARELLHLTTQVNGLHALPLDKQNKSFHAVVWVSN